MTVDAILHRLESLLYGINYSVYLRIYRLPFISDATAERYIAQAFPGAEVGSTQPVTLPDMLAEVEQSLRYAGDAGAGPRRSALRSRKFKELLGRILKHLVRVASKAAIVATFWLKKGHPAYPVFWDFAFVSAGPQGAEVFVGSSSD